MVASDLIPESRFGHHPQFLFRLFTYSVIWFGFVVSSLHLFIGSTQHREDRNKELPSVSKAAEVGPQYPFTSAVPAWQKVAIP